MFILRLFCVLLLLGALGSLGGCATTGYYVNDTLESYNRAMFGFNDSVDKAILQPAARGYKAALPEAARMGVTNFFGNLGDVWIGINNILQGKVAAGVNDFGRVAINTTVGILGLFDVASNAGLDKHNEDFGQTLGRWGVGSGAYVVLPILGPSSVRDSISLLAADWHGDPVLYVANIPTRSILAGVRVVDNRASLLDVGRLAEEAALDYYSYVRGAYLQRRRSLIYDGEPPREPDPDQSSAADPGKPAPVQAEAERPQQVAAGQAAAGALALSYQPMVPHNYGAVLAAAAESRTGREHASGRP